MPQPSAIIQLVLMPTRRPFMSTSAPPEFPWDALRPGRRVFVSLGFALVFMLAGLGQVALLHTFRNLLGLFEKVCHLLIHFSFLCTDFRDMSHLRTAASNLHISE